MTLSLPPAMQLAAYAANIALIVAAWRFPRLRAYALVLLVSDVMRFVAGFVPLHHDTSMRDLALYGIDGALVLAPMPVLVWALRLEHRAVMGMLACVWCVAMIDAHAARLDDVASAYVASLAVAHLYATIGPFVDRKVRRDLKGESGLLLGLAATGTSGTIVAATWDQWSLVNAGNIIAHCVVAVAARVVMHRDQRRKTRV